MASEASERAGSGLALDAVVRTDDAVDGGHGGGAGSVGVVGEFVSWLAGVDGAGLADDVRVDLIGVLEAVKGAAAAAQARVTARFAHSQRAVHVARGGKVSEAARSVGSQVALARRDSPSRGDQHVGFARALVQEMPATLAALTSGVISEYRAALVVRETACLTREQRGLVDARLAPDLALLGNRSLAAAARRVAAEVDAAAVVARMDRAVASRRVTVRPAPDGMAWLTFLAPLTDAVGAYAALDRLAKTTHATTTTSPAPPADTSPDAVSTADAVAEVVADSRTRGQLMVDLGLDRILGRTPGTLGTGGTPGTGGTSGTTGTGGMSGMSGVTGGSGFGGRVDVEVCLVMTPDTLLAGGSDPAHLPGYGPIPAPVARAVVADADRVWIRRLFTSPTGRDLVGLDSRRRFFDGGLRRVLGGIRWSV